MGTDNAPMDVSPTLDADASFLLARASALTAAAGNRGLSSMGLKVRSYSVLALAVEVGPSQRELAERLRLDPSQIVALVDALESGGYVERRQAPGDRRARTVTATPAGVELFARARAAVDVSQREIFASFSDSESDAFRALLRRVAYSDLR